MWRATGRGEEVVCKGEIGTLEANGTGMRRARARRACRSNKKGGEKGVEHKEERGELFCVVCSVDEAEPIVSPLKKLNPFWVYDS
jgi:hypothetical protein